MVFELHSAARDGDTTRVIQLLGKGQDINERDTHSRTALHLAAWAGRTEVVDLLIAQGCQVSAAAIDDTTALHFAAQKGHSDVVATLLQAGVHVDSRTRKGLTALHMAAHGGHIDTVEVLLSRHANPVAKNKRNQTPLETAVDPVVKKVLQDAVPICKVAQAHPTQQVNVQQIDQSVKHRKVCEVDEKTKALQGNEAAPRDLGQVGQGTVELEAKHCSLQQEEDTEAETTQMEPPTKQRKVM